MTQLLQNGSVLLQYDRLLFTIGVTTLLALPPYKGGVLHSAFGNILRRECCRNGRRECTPCESADGCIYARLFEPTPPPHYKDAGKYRKPPLPLILNPPGNRETEFKPGTVLQFELVVIGVARELLPFLIYTVERMGACGLGQKRGRYRLLKVDIESTRDATRVYDGTTKAFGPLPPDDDRLVLESGGSGDCSRAELSLLTPLRMKQDGHLATELPFRLVVERIVHRLQLLIDLYGSGSELRETALLLSEAGHVRIASEHLYWLDWSRYSRRQETSMKLGGITGKILFFGALDRFMPYLRAGEHLNLGQASSFGLGKYRAIFG